MAEKYSFISHPDGSFHITIGGVRSATSLYEGVAALEHNGRRFAAVSAYFEGLLPHEKVFEILSLSPEQQESKEGPDE